MPRGRQSNPSTDTVGNWYKHSTCKDYLGIGSRADATSTGRTFRTSSREPGFPLSAPPKFSQISLDLYQKDNPFSLHDNRNNIQLKGEYFGDGRGTRTLGKRLAAGESNQHQSDVGNFLRHHSREQTDSFFYSNYTLSHDSKNQTPSAQNRRFPRQYSDPSLTSTELRTTTIQQEPESQGQALHRTSTQTLVSSLEPRLCKNTWKYSYHRHKKFDIYPKAYGDRCTAHIAESKPRLRPVVVDRVQRECSKIQQVA